MAVADIVEGECDGPIKPGSARGLPGQSIRITEDGSIVKTCLTIVESDLVECPPPLSRVSVHLKISRKSNADVVLFESTVEEVEFCLGRAETARGLEIALATMKPGESALIEVKPSHGFNKLNRPTEFPESAINDTLIFEVDLLRWEHEINIWAVSNHAKVDFAQKQHQLGNQQYSEQKYRTSLKTYKRATDAIEAINEQKDPLPPADLKESKHLLFLCLSNAGACHIRLQNWDEAIFSCTKALTLEPNNVKCLYRRGLAYGRREEYAVALKDLRKAHTIEPNLLVRDAIREVKQAELEANECIRKKLDGFLKNGLDLYADKPDPNGSSLWNYVKLSFLRVIDSTIVLTKSLQDRCCSSKKRKSYPKTL